MSDPSVDAPMWRRDEGAYLEYKDSGLANVSALPRPLTQSQHSLSRPLTQQSFLGHAKTSSTLLNHGGNSGGGGMHGNSRGAIRDLYHKDNGESKLRRLPSVGAAAVSQNQAVVQVAQGPGFSLARLGSWLIFAILPLCVVSEELVCCAGTHHRTLDSVHNKALLGGSAGPGFKLW
jgi:hypothetical protein